jgi:hypothetical protein
VSHGLEEPRPGGPLRRLGKIVAILVATLILCAVLGLVGLSLMIDYGITSDAKRNFSRVCDCPESEVDVDSLGGDRFRAEGCGKTIEFTCDGDFECGPRACEIGDTI